MDNPDRGQGGGLRRYVCVLLLLAISAGQAGAQVLAVQLQSGPPRMCRGFGATHAHGLHVCSAVHGASGGNDGGVKGRERRHCRAELAAALSPQMQVWWGGGYGEGEQILAAAAVARARSLWRQRPSWRLGGGGTATSVRAGAVGGGGQGKGRANNHGSAEACSSARSAEKRASASTTGKGASAGSAERRASASTTGEGASARNAEKRASASTIGKGASAGSAAVLHEGGASASTFGEGASAGSPEGRASANTFGEGAGARLAKQARTSRCHRISRSSPCLGQALARDGSNEWLRFVHSFGSPSSR